MDRITLNRSVSLARLVMNSESWNPGTLVGMGLKGPRTSEGPDLVVGYNQGYGCSDESTLGEITEEVEEWLFRNTQADRAIYSLARELFEQQYLNTVAAGEARQSVATFYATLGNRVARTKELSREVQRRGGEIERLSGELDEARAAISERKKDIAWLNKELATGRGDTMTLSTRHV